jgi:hypothetical protein
VCGAFGTLAHQAYTACLRGQLSSNVRPHMTRKPSFPPELRRYLTIVVGLSLFLACAGAVALFVAVSPNTTGGPVSVLMLFAVAAFSLSVFGLVYVPRWYRRAACVVNTAVPLPGAATLLLESESESTSLYATISRPEASAEVLDRVAVLFPRWDIRPFLGTSISVDLHVDPSTSRLMAITSKHGVLWCIPTGQVLRERGAV